MRAPVGIGCAINDLSAMKLDDAALWGSIRHDRREQLGHLVGGPAGDGIAVLVADLAEMIPHLFDRQRRAVIPPCPADEESCDVSSADRVDLPGNRTVPVRQKAATGATSAGSSF